VGANGQLDAPLAPLSKGPLCPSTCAGDVSLTPSTQNKWSEDSGRLHARGSIAGKRKRLSSASQRSIVFPRRPVIGFSSEPVESNP
jgi:hypothetical protein